jgi:hypothetical protein
MAPKINSVKKVNFQTITMVQTDESDSSVAGFRGFYDQKQLHTALPFSWAGTAEF